MSLTASPGDRAGPDDDAFREACSHFASGVTIVSARGRQGARGMTVSAFISVSLSPPLIAVSLALGSTTLGRVEESGRYAVSILPEDKADLAVHFAGHKNENAAVPWQEFGGLPVIAGACAHMAADLDQAVTAGDHRLLIGRVRDLRTRPGEPPLIWHRRRFVGLVEP